MTTGPALWGAAALLWVVIAMVPGFLAATALAPRTSLLEKWAVSPLVSLGVAFAAAAWVDRVRPGSGLAAAGWALLLITAVSGAVVLRRDRRIRLLPGRWRPEHTVLAAAVALAVAVDVLVLSRAGSSWGTVVPNWDGSAHGRLTGRILTTGSVDPNVVAATDFTAIGSGGYYPVGLHTMAALVSRVTGVQAGLTVVAFLAAAIWAPLGIAAWGRRIADPRVAVVAAVVVAVATPWLFWAPAYWGFWPLVVAVTLVPAGCAALIGLHSWPAALLALLAVCGLASVHPPEVMIVALVVGATLLLDDTGRRERLRTATWALSAGVLGSLLASPRPGAVATAGSALPVNESLYPWPVALGELLIRPATGRVPDDISVWAAIASVTWWSLVVYGAVLLVRRARARGTIAVVALLTVAAMLAFVDVADRLTSPWYSNGYRFIIQLAELAALPIAAALVGLVAAARAPGPRRGAARVALPVAGFACVLLVVASVRTAGQSLTASVVSRDDRAAYSWLATHTQPGEPVLNQPVDGSTWLYPETRGRVLPLLLEGRGVRYDTTAATADKYVLLDRAADYATDPAVRSLAARWGVRYVLVGDGSFAGSAPRLDAAALATSSGVRAVFRSGSVVVYEFVG